MKWFLIGMLALISSLVLACEDREPRDVDTYEPPRQQLAPEQERQEPTIDERPVREPQPEGPAERTGKIIDEVTKDAAESVGRGLEEAGEEVQRHVPEDGR